MSLRRPRAPIFYSQCRTMASASILNTRRKSLAFSNDSIVTKNTAVPVSDWLFVSAWLTAMADESGSSPHAEKDQPSSSASPGTLPESVPRRLNLLLAEDNLPDALLVREAIQAEQLEVDVH